MTVTEAMLKNYEVCQGGFIFIPSRYGFLPGLRSNRFGRLITVDSNGRYWHIFI
jgi:hypothetical protein